MKDDKLNELEKIKESFKPFRDNPKNAFYLSSAPWFDYPEEYDEKLIDLFILKFKKKKI